MFLGQISRQVADGFLGQGCVLVEDFDHHLDRDGVFADVPDVVIGDVRHHSVAHLGLARQKSLRRGGHPDDVHAPGAKGVGFGFGGEPRPLDGDEYPTAVNHRSGCLRGLEELSREVRAERR